MQNLDGTCDLVFSLLDFRFYFYFISVTWSLDLIAMFQFILSFYRFPVSYHPLYLIFFASLIVSLPSWFFFVMVIFEYKSIFYSQSCIFFSWIINYQQVQTYRNVQLVCKYYCAKKRVKCYSAHEKRIEKLQKY